jgi:hypothetical protein
VKIRINVAEFIDVDSQRIRIFKQKQRSSPIIPQQLPCVIGQSRSINGRKNVIVLSVGRHCHVVIAH